MNNPIISNQNQRTSAIFKTIGIYIITLLVLILCFRNIKGGGNVGEEMSNKIAFLEQDTSDLKGMIQKLDTIATLTKEQNIKNENGELDLIEQQIKDIHGQLYQLSKNPRLTPQFDASQSIYSDLRFIQAKVTSLLITNESQKEKFEATINSKGLADGEQIIKVQQEQSQESSNWNNEKLNLNQSINEKRDEILNLNKDLENASKKLGLAKVDVAKMVNYLTEELSDTPKRKDLEAIVNEINIKINSLSTMLKNVN